jgi:hypothetical protein
MPEISRFFGIVIAMYFEDHEPPHFHAYYGSASARVRISPIGVLTGKLPPRLLALVMEWATIHEAELLDNWTRLRADRPPLRIAPLE